MQFVCDGISGEAEQLTHSGAVFLHSATFSSSFNLCPFKNSTLESKIRKVH